MKNKVEGETAPSFDVEGAYLLEWWCLQMSLRAKVRHFSQRQAYFRVILPLKGGANPSASNLSTSSPN